MQQEQLILLKRSLNIYNTETEAWTALDNLTHTQGQPVVAFFRKPSDTHGDTTLGAIFAIGTANGVGKYKACSSHDDMLAVAQALNTHISEWTAFKATFDKMFEYDANHEAIKAKLDFYTDSNKNISAGGLGGSGSSSLGALYQLIDVMINSTGDGVEGAAEGSVLAYDATAGKWKAIAQSEILPNMSDYYTKEETDAAINAIPIYSMAKLSASDIASLSDGTNVREAYRLKKGGNNVDDTVIKIYKDSAIKSLELRDNKYLVLTYTDNEGNEQSISNDLSVIVNDNYVDLINNQEIGGIKTFTEKTIFKKDINVLGDGIFGGEVSGIVGEGTPAGVTDYSALTGKPSINGKELASGNNTLDELGIQPKGDYTTASQLATTLADYATKVYVSNNYASKAAVNTIQALIPATATADNQLADKDFVNSSIATATAEFRGSFTSLDELKATSGNLNDYAFYLHTDSVGNSIVDRYKWTTAGWLYEYTLNNSSFTAEQWAALNSAITATLVQSYNSHLNNSTIHITAAERAAWNNKWDYDEATIKEVKVNAAVSADKLATPRTIWGQSFDGSMDVTAPAKMQYLEFANVGNNSIGYIGKGASDADTLFLGTYVESDVHLFSRYLSNSLILKPSGNVLIGTTTDNGYKLQVNGSERVYGDLIVDGEVAAIVVEGTPAGVTDYSALTGKPAINGVTLLSGNNTLASLGIQAAGDYATNSGVTTLLADYAKKTFVANNYTGKAAFNSHIADTDIHITSAERVAWNAKWDYDEATIKGVKVTSASSADSVAWSGIKDKPSTFTPSAHTHTASEVSGLPTSLKNPFALTFGSKTYDGSAAATITASDLGALTAHQTIYALTLQVNSVSQGTYNPASAAKTINIAVPTKTSDITNDSGFITSTSIPTALKNPYAVEIKANGVSLGTYDGSAAATFNLSAANVGAANKVHSHAASEISGLPTNLSAFTNDVGFITGITKPMVEGVLTGDITSHTHSQYLTSALRPAKFGTTNSYSSGYYKIKINSPIEWMLSFDVKIYQNYQSYTIRFSGYNYNTRHWYRSVASLLDGDNTIDVKFGYDAARKLWVAIPAGSYTGISITNIANGHYQIDTYALDQLFDITYEETLSGTTQETITLYPPSKSDHTHTFASLTSKPTTIAGYGITDAYTASTIDSKLSGYLPLSGGTMSGSLNFSSGLSIKSANNTVLEMYLGADTYMRGSSHIYLSTPSLNYLDANGTVHTIIHSGNFNSYAPTLTGTGASGTWGISVSGNAATVGGFSVSYGSDTPWGTIPVITTGGYMDVGKHFEFHYDNTTGSYYSTILACTGNYANTVNLPSASGTLALLTDNVASATKLQTPRNIFGLPFDGTSDVNGDAHITGNLIVDGEVSALVA